MALKSEGKALRVGAAQFDAVAGNITANAATHETLIDEAGGLGVEVLVFPELSLPGYASSVLNQTPERCVVDPDGPDLNPLRDACRRNRIVAVVGGCLRNARGLGLSAIVVDRQGQICATYDKQHLSGPEQDWFVPGASGCMIEVDGWLLALGICYDSSFPEHGRPAFDLFHGARPGKYHLRGVRKLCRRTRRFGIPRAKRRAWSRRPPAGGRRPRSTRNRGRGTRP